MSIFIWLCATTFLIIIAVTYKTLNISKSDNEGYFFANRSLSGFSLAATLLATQVGGGMLIGICDMAYTSGIMGYMYAFGQIIGLVLVFLFVSKTFQSLKLQTTSEIFTLIYQSDFLRKLASILSVISLGIILIAQAVAIKKLFISIGFTTNIPLYLLWTAVVGYTSLGGFSVVVKTDIIQISLICLGLFLLAVNIPASNYQSISKKLILTQSISMTSFFNYLIWPCCYLLIEQDMVQRFGSAKNLKCIKAAILWTILGTLCIASVPLLMGLFAEAQGLDVPNNASVLIIFAQSTLSPWVYNIALFILLMAIISTVDSILCAMSCLISCDKLINTKLQNSYFKNIFITIVIGALALLGSLFASSVLKTLVFSYGLTASALFVPVCIALLGISKSKLGATISVLSGILTYCIMSIFNENLTILSLIMSAIGFFIGVILQKQPLFIKAFAAFKFRGE